MNHQLPETLGIRHIALNVQNVARSKAFYTEVMGMQVEWEPDPENIYLTRGGHDNLALHRATANDENDARSSSALDHFGIVLKRPEDVDHWFQHVRKHEVEIVKEIKTHRDGARSFYMRDPDGIVIQLIYHPPISDSTS